MNGYDAHFCPVSKTLELISGKWKPIILYLVEHNINRFGLLRKKMPRISKKILTEQLRELEEQGLLSREVKVSRHPQEVFYALTDRGVSLRRLIDSVFLWGMNNLLDSGLREEVEIYVIKTPA